jgi:protein-tyrosine-phosphatase
MYSVLFLCTGNCARSILAEALLDRWGQGKFRAFSAGSNPAGYVHPLALDLLQKRGLPTALSHRLRRQSMRTSISLRSNLHMIIKTAKSQLDAVTVQASDGP